MMESLVLVHDAGEIKNSVSVSLLYLCEVSEVEYTFL